MSYTEKKINFLEINFKLELRGYKTGVVGLLLKETIHERRSHLAISSSKMVPYLLS